jgi:hypothetical protein
MLIQCTSCYATHLYAVHVRHLDCHVLDTAAVVAPAPPQRPRMRSLTAAIRAPLCPCVKAVMLDRKHEAQHTAAVKSVTALTCSGVSEQLRTLHELDNFSTVPLRQAKQQAQQLECRALQTCSCACVYLWRGSLFLSTASISTIFSPPLPQALYHVKVGDAPAAALAEPCGLPATTPSSMVRQLA